MARKEYFSSSEIKSNDLFDGDSKVVDKIQKLLRLSSSDNQNEAQLAMQRAQELMAKHNIEMGEAKETEVVDSFIIGEETKGLSSNRKLLAAAMAPHFQVFLIITLNDKMQERISVIGRIDDVKIFLDSFNWTYNAANQLFKNFLKEQGSMSRSQSIALKNDYFAGFRLGLTEALKKNVTEKSLMIRVPDCVEEFVEAKYPHLRKGKPVSKTSANSIDAILAGRRDGGSVKGMKNALNA